MLSVSVAADNQINFTDNARATTTLSDTFETDNLTVTIYRHFVFNKRIGLSMNLQF